MTATRIYGIGSLEQDGKGLEHPNGGTCALAPRSEIPQSRASWIAHL